MITVSDFARQIALLGGLPNRVTIALSGGADSMCLAYLLARYRNVHSPQTHISAVTIDHGYRVGSDVEARKVGSIVEKWGICHTVHKLTWDTDPRLISNFEEAARTQRLRALRKFCLDREINSVFMGHNQNDLVETFLQRLQMNSTVYGLVGLKGRSVFPGSQNFPDSSENYSSENLAKIGKEIREKPVISEYSEYSELSETMETMESPKNSEKPMEFPEKSLQSLQKWANSEFISIYRPLLAFNKAEIVATCRTNHVPWVEDSSNADIHLTKRNLLRYAINEVVPGRPGLSSIAYSNLVQTIGEVQALVDFLEKGVASIELHDRVFDPKRNRLTFSMAICRFWTYEPLDFLVFSRWFFHQISPLSSSTYLHWGYAKIHRNFVPGLAEFIRSQKKEATFCYLNVKIHVQKREQTLYFAACNEVQKNCKMVVDQGWKCFDRLWWMKSSGPAHKSYTAIYYHSSLKRQFLASFPSWPSRGLMKDLGNVPVIMDGERLVGVPTWNLWVQNVSVTWTKRQ